MQEDVKNNYSLVQLSYLYNGNINKMYKHLQKKQNINTNLVLKKTENIISIIDFAYPQEFKNIAVPPLVLYYRGNLNLLQNISKIAIIGSRHHSYYGKIACNQLIASLAKTNTNYTIISGLANGIDSISHEGALKYHLPTIAIIGYSFLHLDNSYENIQNLANKIISHGGLIISEFPNTGYKVAGEDFKTRNRLIAGLSSKLIIVEAKNHSGTMNTVKHCLEQNKDIYCLPGVPFSDSGCNKLIQEGAVLFDNIKDLSL